MTATTSTGSNSTRHRIIAALEEGEELGVDGAIELFGAQGEDLRALCALADERRREQVGDAVTWVVNRNINFTNVCVKNCRFCAFSRDLRSEQGYFLPLEEILRRVDEAVALGATEVCIQAGLAPSVDGSIYIELCDAIHRYAPDVHIHAFSPEEVKYGAQRAGISFTDYLRELKAVGLGSLPGTSAEILDDELRREISPGRIKRDEWVEVVLSAHELGIPTTSTMMFGHVETPRHRAEHLALLRELQRVHRGFTEFVPLSFVHEEAPLFATGKGNVRPGPTGNDVLRLYAIARLMLGADIPNLQASWVKEGPRMTQVLLDCGVNDLGGTLMNESISTAAGAANGQLMTPAALRRIVEDAGRTAVERTTLYAHRKVYTDATQDDSPLDTLTDPDGRFGTYRTLSEGNEHRFVWEGGRAPAMRPLAATSTSS